MTIRLTGAQETTRAVSLSSGLLFAKAHMCCRALGSVPVIRPAAAQLTLPRKQRQHIKGLSGCGISFSCASTTAGIRSRKKGRAASTPLQVRSTTNRSFSAKMPQLAPPDPEKVMVIRKVCDDIVTCSLPFARLGVLKFGGRATIG